MARKNSKKEKPLELEKYELSGLYYRYKKTTDDDIRKYLEKIKIVGLGDHGVGSIHGYYEIADSLLKRVKENPRGISYQFELKLSKNLVDDLKPYKRIVFLVKSSSRFFLKPDIGEVFDAIDPHDLWGNKIKAIYMESGEQGLPGTDGEHFLMVATLFN